MSQGGFVTLVGFVAIEPSLRTTKDGHHVADVRVGTASRMLDKQTGEWVDGETSFYTVTCWRRLADHAKASLRKGDPVLVKGRFRTSSYEDKTGRLRTEVEIVADTVGHDLSRGIANYIRPERPRQDAAGDPATSGPAGSDSIDEEAIERFGREMDEALPGAEFAASALGPDDAAAPF
ncbi:MAG: single-stranded DNA-binding protein [Streptosporangiaceae bacterium]